nr:hypothetical protein [Tanacetum cinerariifolium]
MDDPNITMEEHIRLEEEKSHRRGKMYNWETTTYGKIWYDEDVHNLRSVETEFPSIVFNDTLTSNLALSCEPMHRSIMDDLNINMKEYIRLEEEKARRQGQTFNWQTITYGKMKYCENEDDSFMNLETEYPAIVFDDTSDAALSCEPTVTPLDNSEIDFKISFCESDDEDYMRCNMELTAAAKNRFIELNELMELQDRALDTAYPWVWDTAY